MTRYFKALRDHSGTTQYGYGHVPLPISGPGDWVPEITGELVPCKRGYHVPGADDLRHLVHVGVDSILLEVTLRDGDGLKHDAGGRQSKTLCHTFRPERVVEAWNRTTLIAWAADCAEHVLHIYEGRYPDDTRPRTAIEAARNGNRSAAAYAAADRRKEQDWQTARLLAYLDGGEMAGAEAGHGTPVICP